MRLSKLTNVLALHGYLLVSQHWEAGDYVRDAEGNHVNKVDKAIDDHEARRASLPASGERPKLTTYNVESDQRYSEGVLVWGHPSLDVPPVAIAVKHAQRGEADPDMEVVGVAASKPLAWFSELSEA
jgi:hypothetical protein